MSALSSRRKAKVRKPRAKRKQTFRIVIDAQQIVVTYEPNWTDGMALFEFRSPHEPKRPIPISETGFRSHFVEMWRVKESPSPEEYALEAGLFFFNKARKVRQEPDQLSMF